mgnify:CR=1 FL=1
MNIRREEPKDYRESENVCPYFLMKELTPGYLGGVTGTYHTPEGYFVSEEEVEEFDKTFPPKKKEKLPGQIF